MLITGRCLQDGGAFPWKPIYFCLSINHNTITGCKTLTSIVLKISKIPSNLSEVLVARVSLPGLLPISGTVGTQMGPPYVVAVAQVGLPGLLLISGTMGT